MGLRLPRGRPLRLYGQEGAVTTILSRPRLLLPVVLLTALAALSIAACGGGDSSDKLVLTPVNTKYLPTVISDDLAVGQNRFVLGLLTQEDNTPVVDAVLHLRFFLLDGAEGTLKFEAEAKPLKITRSYTHTHPDGTVETHEVGDTGAYDATVTFDTAGTWGVEVAGTVAGEPIEPVRPTFSVNQKSFGLSVGDAAPRSVQTLLKDVTDIRDIDTSEVPIPEMHDKTIADAVTSGKATLVIFATPAFCQSQICGPTKSIVDDLYARYSAQANFVHVEPYDVVRLRNNNCPSLEECISPVLDEWKLQSEPWVFLVDKNGNIAAKFEAIVTLDELEAALAPLLG